MPDLGVSLAGIPLGISALYPSTKNFFRDYLTEQTPTFCVATAPEDIEYERAQSALQDEKEGIPVRQYSDRYLETVALLRKIATRLPAYSAVLFHGSVVAVDGKAYLFTAPSGVGKTTHTMHWLNLLPNAHVLNGDKPFLKVEDGQVLACGTPWRGKEQYGCNEILPLMGIAFLERSHDNSMEPVTAAQAPELLLRQVYWPSGADEMLETLRLCEQIGSGTKLYRLRCNAQPASAVVSSGAMLVQE